MEIKPTKSAGIGTLWAGAVSRVREIISGPHATGHPAKPPESPGVTYNSNGKKNSGADNAPTFDNEG